MKTMACVALAIMIVGTAVDAFLPAATFRSPIGTSAPAKVVSRSSTLRMVSVGEAPPDFKLQNQSGKTVSLSSFTNKKKVVVFFYPKDSTPGCTKEVCTFQSDLDQYKKLGAEVIGISSDADHTAFVKENDLSFTLLSDIGGQVRKDWKVKRAAFGAMDGRVTYVIDKSGVVTKIYDNLLDGAAHSREALKAL
ncbi:unnamed protein product [Ascophyllum nodosum]